MPLKRTSGNRAREIGEVEALAEAELEHLACGGSAGQDGRDPLELPVEALGAEPTPGLIARCIEPSRE